MGILDGNELRFVVRCSGSVIPKGLVWAIPSALLAVALHRLFENTDIRSNIVDQDGQIWSTFYYVLGVLLVFRTNQAYSRYWEGATLLLEVRGEWFNAASSLVAFCSSDVRAKAQVEKFQHLLVRLMSMLYCTALQKIALIPADQFETINTAGIDAESLAFLEHTDEQCEVLVHWIQRHVIEGYNTGVLEVPAPILSRVFQELSRGLVNAQNVRKIAEVPFPFPYTQMSIVMLLASSILTPVLAGITSSTSWEAGFLAFMPTLTFWCLNYMAAEIEQPFGEDANDLPIPEMASMMNNSLRRLVNPHTQHLPEFAYDHYIHSPCPLESWGAHAGKATIEVADRRYAADFSKRRRNRPPTLSQPAFQSEAMSRVTSKSSSTPRTDHRHSTAPPDCRSPDPSSPSGRQPGVHSPKPPPEPAELLRLATGDSGPRSTAVTPTSPISRKMSTSEAVAEAARQARLREQSSVSLPGSPLAMQPVVPCSPMAVEPVVPGSPLSVQPVAPTTAWSEEPEAVSNFRVRRFSQNWDVINRPPGWRRNVEEGDPEVGHQMSDVGGNSAAFNVVPSQVGGLRLGPPSPARRSLQCQQDGKALGG